MGLGNDLKVSAKSLLLGFSALKLGFTLIESEKSPRGCFMELNQSSASFAGNDSGQLRGCPNSFIRHLLYSTQSANKVEMDKKEIGVALVE